MLATEFVEMEDNKDDVVFDALDCIRVQDKPSVLPVSRLHAAPVIQSNKVIEENKEPKVE